MSAITAPGFTNRAFTTPAFPTRAMGAEQSVPVTRLRLTRRGRRVVSALVVAPFIALGLALGAASTEATATLGAEAPVTVTVEAGQTLWQLAASVAPGANPADVVADILTLNGLESAAVLPGQTLLLPERYLD